MLRCFLPQTSMHLIDLSSQALCVYGFQGSRNKEVQQLSTEPLRIIMSWINDNLHQRTFGLVFFFSLRYNLETHSLHSSCLYSTCCEAASSSRLALCRIRSVTVKRANIDTVAYFKLKNFFCHFVEISFSLFVKKKKGTFYWSYKSMNTFYTHCTNIYL